MPKHPLLPLALVAHCYVCHRAVRHPHHYGTRVVGRHVGGDLGAIQSGACFSSKPGVRELD